MYSPRIPADGFGSSGQSMYQTILQTPELDIPPQEQTLATYRCEELKNAALTEALTALPTYLHEAEEGRMDDFTWATDIVGNALALYDEHAPRYEHPVYSEKREQLLQQLQAELQRIVDAHLAHMRRRIVSEASTTLDLLFGAGAAPDCWVQFAEIADRWRNESLSEFDQLAAPMVLTFTDDGRQTSRIEFDSSLSRQALLESLDATLLRLQWEQQNSLAQVIGRRAGGLLGSPVGSLRGRDLTQQGFWNTMNTSTNNVTETVMNDLGSAWFGLHSNRNVQTEHWREYARAQVIQQLRLNLESACEGLENYVVDRFNEYFNKDEAGVPRRWQDTPVNQLDEIYWQAYAKGFDVVNIFEAVGKQVFGVSLLSSDRKEQIQSYAKGEMQTAYGNARSIRDQAMEAIASRRRRRSSSSSDGVGDIVKTVFVGALFSAFL